MSITVTMQFFLYIYLTFIVMWLLFVAVAIFHLLKYGFKNFSTFFIVLAILFVSCLLMLISNHYIEQIDWSAEINLFNNSFQI